MKTLLVLNLLAVLAVGYVAWVSMTHVAMIEQILFAIISRSAAGQNS